MGYLHFKEERLTRVMFKLPTCPSTTHPFSTNNPPQPPGGNSLAVPTCWLPFRSPHAARSWASEV